MALQIELIPADDALLRRLVQGQAKALAGLCNNAAEIADTVKAVAASQLALYRRNGARAPWIGYFVRSGDSIMGVCSFTGPPKDGAAEIAYFTFPPYEGRGVSSAAAARLVEAALGREEIVSVIAFTLPERNASTRILEKLGFRRDGTAQDKDAGEVWQWRKIRVR